jgi:hypothetical protein
MGNSEGTGPLAKFHGFSTPIERTLSLIKSSTRHAACAFNDTPQGGPGIAMHDRGSVLFVVTVALGAELTTYVIRQPRNRDRTWHFSVFPGPTDPLQAQVPIKRTSRILLSHSPPPNPLAMPYCNLQAYKVTMNRLTVIA